MRHLPFASDGRLENEAIDAQAADVDVDIGKQRIARVGNRLELRHALQSNFLGGRRANVDMVGKIGKGPPVDPQFGRRQKYARGVRQGEIAHDHRAVKRSVEPTDADLHPVFKLKLFDLGNDEAPSGIAVEPDEKECEQRDKTEDRNRGAARDARGPARCCRIGGDRRRLFHHQKACPIDT